jgi:ferredoxin
VSAGVEVRIDRERCMGSGNCLFLAPETFDQDESGLAVVLDPAATPDERLVVVADGCPVGAISVWRDGTRLDKGHP